MIKTLISKALSGNATTIFKDLNLAPDKQKQAVNLAEESVISGLSESLKAGKTSEITNAFSNGQSSSLVEKVISNYAANLIAKLGMNKSTTNAIAKSIIPMIFSHIGKSDEAKTDTDEGVKGMLGDLVGQELKGKLGGLTKNLF